MDTYEVTSSTTSALEPRVPRDLVTGKLSSERGAHDLLAALDEHDVTDIMNLLSNALRTTPTASSARIINSEAAFDQHAIQLSFEQGAQDLLAALDEHDITDILYSVNPPTRKSANVQSLVEGRPASEKKMSDVPNKATLKAKFLSKSSSAVEQPASRERVSAAPRRANIEE